MPGEFDFEKSRICSIIIETFASRIRLGVCLRVILDMLLMSAVMKG